MERLLIETIEAKATRTLEYIRARKLIPQRKERVGYLCSTVGTTTGWPLASIWDFTWRIVVADVTHPPPLIGADFLPHFGLLVDCRKSRLLDGVTAR
jgi:hypothetical protein